MKVLHLAEVIKGGIATWLNEVYPLQAEAFGEENVHFFIPQQHEAYLRGIPASAVTTFDCPKRSPKSWFNFLITSRKLIKEFQPDVLHVHSTFAGVLVRVPYLLMPWAKRPRIVYCAHGWSFIMTDDKKSMIYAWIERVLANVTDVIHNISHNEEKMARYWKLPYPKMQRIYNGIALKAPKVELVDGVKMDPKQINLLYVGRFDYAKGIDILLAALNDVDMDALNIHLYIAGGYAQKVRDDLVFPKNVTLLGWLTPEQLAGLYAQADAVVIPSRWDGFNLVGIEAMRAGTACIVSNRAALPELVVAGETGVVFDLDDPTVLQNILKTTYKEQLQKWGENGKQRFEAMFTAQHMHEDLLKAYVTK